MTTRRAAGIDLGGTKIHSLIATEDGDVLGEDHRPTEAAQGPYAVIDRMVASVRAALADAGLTTNDVVGVGISSPGPCDPVRGVVTDAPNLPGWHEIPLVQRISDAMALPVLLENDANAAAYGEFRFGAGVGLKHILYITVSTGIGGGIIVDGKIYEGASGAAGEVGHIILDDNGPPCNCGNRGCLEAISSGAAIQRDAAEAIASGRSPRLAQLAAGRPPTAEQVHQAALEGDGAARAIISRAGYYLGLGLVGLLHCFDPEMLILGGGLVGLGDLYLEPALKRAREGAFPQIAADVTIITAKLGQRAGALGAAALMMTTAPPPTDR
jgi:glucokinase